MKISVSRAFDAAVYGYTCSQFTDILADGLIIDDSLGCFESRTTVTVVHWYDDYV